MPIKKQTVVTREHPFKTRVAGDTLDLSRQALTDKDIPALIRFLHDHPFIHRLNLAMNNISCRGLADFAERNQTIITADFSGNLIRDMGVLAFAHQNRTVVEVNFSRNRVSTEAVHQFAAKNMTCSSCQFTVMQDH